MTAPRNNLTARERFNVANYLIAHIDELRPMSSNVERARHVGEALGLPMTAANLTKAAEAANVILTPPPKPKPAPGGAMAELLRGLFERVEALEAAQEKTNALVAALRAVSVPINPRYAHTMDSGGAILGDADALTRVAQHVPTGAAVPPAPGITHRTTLL